MLFIQLVGTFSLKGTIDAASNLDIWLSAQAPAGTPLIDTFPLPPERIKGIVSLWFAHEDLEESNAHVALYGVVSPTAQALIDDLKLALTIVEGVVAPAVTKAEPAPVVEAPANAPDTTAGTESPDISTEGVPTTGMEGE